MPRRRERLAQNASLAGRQRGKSRKLPRALIAATGAGIVVAAGLYGAVMGWEEETHLRVPTMSYNAMQYPFAGLRVSY